ncbi:hypothetical protein [Albidovulum sp.]|uniref:hypothetical protein n=1 Tax=Albidovulum sp. TaxID=1872424 RepID=UPI003527E21F
MYLAGRNEPRLAAIAPELGAGFTVADLGAGFTGADLGAGFTVADAMEETGSARVGAGVDCPPPGPVFALAGVTLQASSRLSEKAIEGDLRLNAPGAAMPVQGPLPVLKVPEGGRLSLVFLG